MERRGESSGRRSSPTSGMTACHSASVRLCIGRSCSMHQRTACPTFSWALRNGTPRSTRYSATSVARMRPSAKPRFAFSSSTSTCARSGGRTEKMSLRQSSVRKRPRLSSWRSRLYVSGMPFIIVSRSTSAPVSWPALPRSSSSTSGFFFCGMMLEPVQKESGSLTQPNSVVK